MPRGTAEFTVEVSGFQLPKLEILPPQPKIARITLERTGNAPLKVICELLDVVEADDAKNILRPVLESILDQLAFDLDASIGEPRLTNLSLPQDKFGNIHLETLFDTRRVVTRQDVTPDEEQRKKLQAVVQQSHKSADLYSAYRFAVRQDDAVKRYMFLYNILLRLHGDDQRAVDNFIQQEEPNVQLNTSNRRTKKARKPMETVYTTLRNEVGHVRSQSDPAQTSADIAKYVDRLQDLTRTALQGQP